MAPPQVNHLGRITEHPVDTWEPRRGVAWALQELVPLLEPNMVSELGSFYVSVGLGDRKVEVKKKFFSFQFKNVFQKVNVNLIIRCEEIC